MSEEESALYNEYNDIVKMALDVDFDSKKGRKFIENEKFILFLNKCIDFNEKCCEKQQDFRIVWVWHSANILKLMKKIGIDDRTKEITTIINELNAIFVHKKISSPDKHDITLFELFDGKKNTPYNQETDTTLTQISEPFKNQPTKQPCGLLIIRHQESSHNYINKLFEKEIKSDKAIEKTNFHHLIIDPEGIHGPESVVFKGIKPDDEQIELNKSTLYFTSKLIRTQDTADGFRKIIQEQEKAKTADFEFDELSECIKTILPGETSGYKSEFKRDFDNVNISKDPAFDKIDGLVLNDTLDSTSESNKLKNILKIFEKSKEKLNEYSTKQDESSTEKATAEKATAEKVLEILDLIIKIINEYNKLYNQSTSEPYTNIFQGQIINIIIDKMIKLHDNGKTNFHSEDLRSIIMLMLKPNPEDSNILKIARLIDKMFPDEILLKPAKK